MAKKEKDSENAELSVPKDDFTKGQRINLTNAGTFWDFNENPVFEGQFTGETLKAENDDPENNREAGDVMGYVFVDESGEEHIIGSGASIVKAMEKCLQLGIEKPYLYIEFKGQTTMKKNGRKFNQFKIDVLKD